MKHQIRSLAILIPVVLVCVQPTQMAAMDLVRDGKPVATIVVESSKIPQQHRPNRRGQATEQQAAEVLVDWVRKMTGVELPIAESAPERGPVVYLGGAAVRAGLRINDVESPSHEGLRIRCDGRRLLLAGQDQTATLKAVCRLLEHFGCRYFVDHPLGEVYPRTKTLTVGRLEITEKPGFLYRSIWGSNWSRRSLWKVWNGAGGVPLSMGHAWGQYVSKDLFREHPEYFHLRGGRREPSDWYCTADRSLRKRFSEGVIAKIESGTLHPSISPPDGRGYCECDDCRRQDDPRVIEPSSGQVCVTNRYLDFYQHVAGRVAEKSPDSILSFYCYADYTQAPSGGIKLPPNLCAWIAPIRYCRFHRIGHPNCPSRSQLEELMNGWGAAAEKIAYRTYNYNLAECLVPFCLISVWKHDIPYLKRQGCIGINLETLTNWQIYGPHIYLSIRLAYDPAADADAIMDDYFLKFYGPQAGPIMKQYWTAIDRRFVDLPCHTGSFFALHLVYTPEFLKKCQGLIHQATTAAEAEKTYAARVQMAAEGLRNAAEYVAVRDAINRGDFPAAKRIYDKLLARSERHQETRLGNHYTVGYLKRFVGRHLEAAVAATAPPNRIVQVLADKWRLAYDETDRGVEQGYHRPGFDDSSWNEVATYSNPLDAQGFPDRQTILWYRTKFQIPEKHRRLSLFFTEVDGDARVYLNGKAVGSSQKKRQPFDVDISRAALPGENTVAVRVDHAKITELFLGGIIRPVVLIEKIAPRGRGG